MIERSRSGLQASMRAARNISRASASLETPLTAMRSRRSSTTARVVLVPRSAMRRVSSISSQASSSRSPAERMPSTPRPMTFWDLDMRPRSLPRRPWTGAMSSVLVGAGSGVGSGAGSGAGSDSADSSTGVATGVASAGCSGLTGASGLTGSAFSGAGAAGSAGTSCSGFCSTPGSCLTLGAWSISGSCLTSGFGSALGAGLTSCFGAGFSTGSATFVADPPPAVKLNPPWAW